MNYKWINEHYYVLALVQTKGRHRLLCFLLCLSRVRTPLYTKLQLKFGDGLNVEYNSKYFNYRNWKNGVIIHLDGKSVAELLHEIFIFKLGPLGLLIDNRKFRVARGDEVEMGGSQQRR